MNKELKNLNGYWIQKVGSCKKPYFELVSFYFDKGSLIIKADEEEIDYQSDFKIEQEKDLKKFIITTEYDEFTLEFKTENHLVIHDPEMNDIAGQLTKVSKDEYDSYNIELDRLMEKELELYEKLNTQEHKEKEKLYHQEYLKLHNLVIRNKITEKQFKDELKAQQQIIFGNDRDLWPTKHI
ncbi:hypothetical protein PQO01_04835 [Lentisphaera marina]|uniref:hypothetical protein n=1 Tax=Lentisphaera marina TaxID=1111041 RepID=UPI0023660005|nr:hypothetical protein [Lentisphaera marina]MDD7984271.1 hypothetical protein [Lentisphaera marina]